jgi:hypothetical protein
MTDKVLTSIEATTVSHMYNPTGFSVAGAANPEPAHSSRVPQRLGRKD